jgi:hypothetical protein
MLLLLRSMLGDTVTFCAFEKNRDPTRAEKRRRNNSRFAEEGTRIRENRLTNLEAGINWCTSYKGKLAYREIAVLCLTLSPYLFATSFGTKHKLFTALRSGL